MRKDEFQIVEAYGKQMIKETLQELRRQVEKPLHDERCYATENAKAQYIALNWVCDLIDRKISEVSE